ncbi:MAG: class I SAM-dependent methyltransferase [Myxococcota bacterium]|nr:class I SAM-dependent methyltransferase [Myxococcota bacterium]
MLPLLGDAHARALVDRLDHDFSRFAGRPWFRAVVRTFVFDNMVRSFLGAHPTGTVIELGAGLNTRFERLDNGRQRWFDVDLPEVTSLRRALLSSCARRAHVAASILESSWLELVATAPGPYCFVLEAMLGYVRCDQIRGVLVRIARHFPGATIAFDVHPQWNLVGGELVKSTTPCGLLMADIPRAIERWQIGLTLVEATRFLGLTPRTPGPLLSSATRGLEVRGPMVVARFHADDRRPPIASPIGRSS